MSGDAATYVVNLIDKVSGPAHDAAQAVELLNKRLAKTGGIGYKFGGKGDVPDVIKRLNRQALGTFAKSRILTPALGKMGDGLDWVSNKFVGLAKYSALALGAAGAALAGYAIKGTLHMAMFAESTRMAFGLLTGDKAIGDRVFTRTIELSTQLGLDVEQTAHSMQKLLAMQMSPPDAEKWIKLGADLRAVGVDAGALQRVMLDVAHVKATGKLNQRNVNMFANAGVSSQLLMEEIGKAMGTDEKGAMEAMHKGKITSAIALPALERAIMRKTHSTEAGSAGEGFANQTLGGLVGRLKNAPKLFFLRMADAAEGAIGKLKPLVDAVYKAIDQIKGDQFVKFIEKSLKMVTDMVPLAMEFAAGFGEGFDSVLDAMGMIDPAKDSMKTARDLGHSIADGFGIALKVLNQIMEVAKWFAAHPLTAEMTAGVLAANSLAGGGLIGGALSLGGKGLMAGGKALAGLAGVGGTVAVEAAGATAATTAATTGAGAAGAGAAGVAALAAGIASWAGTAVMAASAAAIGIAILPGLLIAGAGYLARDWTMGWIMPDRKDAADHRGLNASDMPTTTPTAAMASMQRAANSPRNTNVQLHTTVNMDGAGKDGEQLGKDIGEHQRTSLEQFFQSQALEQGAM